MDASGDGSLSAEELVGSGKLEDEELAREVFEALDTSGDGVLLIPEYLRVWGALGQELSDARPGACA